MSDSIKNDYSILIISTVEMSLKILLQAVGGINTVVLIPENFVLAGAISNIKVYTTGQVIPCLPVSAVADFIK